MNIYTIGFTKKSAEKFFSTLGNSGASRLIDVRLNNVSQLAGFAKKDDLRYFCKQICNIDYLHLAELAPTAELLTAYRKKTIDWQTYERNFLDLMVQRRVEQTVLKDLIDGGCLLCSEESPTRCHRRLVAEYLSAKWGNLVIQHLR